MIDDLARRLVHPRFPRSSGYDPRWTIENWMGPNALWLVEWLSTAMDLRPGQRVLDLGCGRAVTSIFLAREFGVRVVAADLWIDPAENWVRVRDAGCAEQIVPLRAEAHDLPFAEGYFDAVVSVDAYHYFGTDQLYLGYLGRFVAPGGRIGIVVPGLAAELEDGRVPDSLAPHWDPELWSFHSPGWWHRLWASSGVVDVEAADRLDGGWQDWLRWSELCQETTGRDEVRSLLEQELPLLRADGGTHLGFTRVVGRRR